MELAHPDLLWALATVPAAALLAAWVWRRRWQATARWAAKGLWNRLFPSHSVQRVTFSVGASEERVQWALAHVRETLGPEAALPSG